MLFLQFAPFLPDYHSEIPSDGTFAFIGRFALAFVLGILGLVGLALVYGAARSAATTSIRADKDGLATGSVRRE